MTATDELIKHLIIDSDCSVCHNAAARLDELDAEIDRLRFALENLLAEPPYTDRWNAIRDQAQTALKPQ